jgi:hypothetical protein
MNWNECGRKRPWPNLWHFASVCLEGVTNATKEPSRDNVSLGRYCNPRGMQSSGQLAGTDREHFRCLYSFKLHSKPAITG